MIVGINSTAVIEARIAGRDVVVPFFAEAAEKHRDRVYFQKYFGKDLLAAHSPAEMLSLTEQAMAAPAPITPGDGEALFEEFLGPSDGRSAERIAALFSRAVEEKRQLRNSRG